MAALVSAEDGILRPRAGAVGCGGAAGGEEYWLFYGSPRFSGKRVTVRPGATFTTTEPGVHRLLVWSGEGTYGGVEVRGDDPLRDELLVVHDRAVAPVDIRCTGTEDLMLISFFGPDANVDVPSLPGPRGRLP